MGKEEAEEEEKMEMGMRVNRACQGIEGRVPNPAGQVSIVLGRMEES